MTNRIDARDVPPRVLFAGLVFQQSGGFICCIHPDAPLVWHPDEVAEYVDVDGGREVLRMRRTARPKSIKAASEALLQGDFDDDAEQQREWLFLRVQNRGAVVELWHSDVVDDLRRARKWPPKSVPLAESAAAVAARDAIQEQKQQAQQAKKKATTKKATKKATTKKATTKKPTT